MNSTPLYIAAAVCGIVALFLGFAAYIDQKPTFLDVDRGYTPPSPDYTLTGRWLGLTLFFLVWASFLP